MEPTWFAKRPVSDVRPGDHGWLAYAGPGERDRVIGTFVRDGLHTNEKVVYVTDAPAEGLPGLCRLDLDGPRRSGQLRVLPAGPRAWTGAGGSSPRCCSTRWAGRSTRRSARGSARCG
nr:MEDS domain-containing protein [Actinomadura sp. J1-007]